MASSNSLLRKAIDKSEARDNALKWSLLERVNDSLKELQLKCTSERSNALCNDESTNSFLWVLEAIFIHGLNNSFLKSSSSSSPFSSLLSSFVGGGTSSTAHHHTSSTAIPNPSFWEFVLVFLHRDIIDQINALYLIHTDVGRCRAWLRISLNDGLLQSFLDNMTLKSNRRCLKAFYRTSAFLRDTEKCDILKNYLMGIELLDFKLVINNSFLNQWNSGPLSLVGIWIDENELIQEGVDIAQNIESNKEFQAIPTIQQRQVQNSQTPPRFYSELEDVLKRQQPPSLQPLLSEDDALRIILSSSPRRSPLPHTTQPSIVSKPLPSSHVTSSKPQELSQSSSRFPENSSCIKTKEQRKPDSHQVQSGSSTVKLSRSKTPTTSLLIETSSTSTATNLQLTCDASTSNEHALANDSCKSQGAEVFEIPTVVPPLSFNSADVSLTTKNNSVSLSSMESDSPVDNAEGSYADMLLKYQQRNQSKESNHEKKYRDQMSISDKAEVSTSNLNLNSDQNLVSSNNEESKRKKSTSGSVNTTITSGFGSKSNKFTRRKGIVTQKLEEPLELLRLFDNDTTNSNEHLPTISKFTKILTREVGLDSQNYACKMCSSSIGMIYGPARLCHFSGALYCTACHINQEKPIPSRILLNWDFGLYFVCKQAFEFLDDIHEKPLFDLQQINALLYSEVDECAEVKLLRTKLFYIGMYLKTCKNTKTLEDLKLETRSCGRDYMLESIHIYTLSDLLAIPNRNLSNALTKFVSTGSGHILSCTICTEKGFICEVCRRPQVIFPFELERIFKCGVCGAVYHKECMHYGLQCPRCERWKKNKLIHADDDEDIDNMKCDKVSLEEG